MTEKKFDFYKSVSPMVFSRNKVWVELTHPSPLGFIIVAVYCDNLKDWQQNASMHLHRHREATMADKVFYIVTQELIFSFFFYLLI